MIALHQFHPLEKGITAAFRFYAKRNVQGCKVYASSLHNLLNEFKIDHSSTTIQLVRCYSKRIPDVDVQIAEKQQVARLDDTLAEEDLRVYSDGSAIDGGVGGAAVLMQNNRMVKEMRFCLGSEEKHTVYEGEIVGMILAVKLLKEAVKERGRGNLTMALGVDNQEAIRATGANFNSKPGHHDYLMDAFHDGLRELLQRYDGRKLVIRWSAGHRGIPGNVAADKQAKRAARGEVSDGRSLPPSLRTKDRAPVKLPNSKSALK